ncbi:hypothetical protein B0T21DRAFT_351997 [Apiosordaria backusii]|uniref:Uncharacterized protein n=1 Tax=Apiosordaria backusii TaxID=314023 RepID=A0AA40DWV0_9PEZI|nr:hypothetical protein B0T21DRAFT_351997 [Apiosordaria backusii]
MGALLCKPAMANRSSSTRNNRTWTQHDFEPNSSHGQGTNRQITFEYHHDHESGSTLGSFLTLSSSPSENGSSAGNSSTHSQQGSATVSTRNRSLLRRSDTINGDRGLARRSGTTTRRSYTTSDRPTEVIRERRSSSETIRPDGFTRRRSMSSIIIRPEEGEVLRKTESRSVTVRHGSGSGRW